MNCPKKMLTYQIRFIKRSRDNYIQNYSEKQAIKWDFMNLSTVLNNYWL